MSELNGGVKLKALIEKRKLSINAAAIQCDVNPSQFKMYVRGVKLRKQTAEKIAHGLRVGVEEIWPEFGEGEA